MVATASPTRLVHSYQFCDDEGGSQVSLRNAGIAPRSVGIVALALMGVLSVGWPDGTSEAQRSISVRGGGPSLLPRYEFEITGSPTKVLAPGVTAPINLALISTNLFDLDVVGLTVTVESIDAPHADDAHPCSSHDFAVRQLEPANVVLELPAKSRRTLKTLGLPRTAWPAITLLNRAVNQDGCKQASVSFTYTASGTPVRS